MNNKPGIGTLGEGPLHSALKRMYSEPGDRLEEPVAGFVIDLVRQNTLIEIQTRGFSSMKRKLKALLDSHPMRVVHPIAVEKWIVKIDASGQVLSRRRSPKKGAFVDLFSELVSFPELLAHPNLTVEVLLTREDELRYFDERKAWRRHGWVVQERQLIEVAHQHTFASPHDLASLLPADLPPSFTTAGLAQSLGRSRRLAQQMVFCLRKVGAIDNVDKQGNAIVYARAESSL